MRLSADESMRAKQLVQSLGAAKERSAKAKVAWEQFHQTYQAAHPNVPGLRFTDDFSLAFALMSSSVDEVRQVTTIELTAEEKRKLDSLHREVTESEQSRRQAERNWRDYQHQLMADHAGNSSTGSAAIVELANDKQVLIPYPWASGLTFTTDFRLAFPLTF
jgi:ADP-ribosylglycohydrolase